jgi:RNA polymerase sigma factor (sigma-70 family)
MSTAALKRAPEPCDTTTSITSCSDSRLVKACLNGDEQAWTALIGKYKRLIYSIPVKYGMGQEHAAEIFQAVCVELFCELRKVRKTESLKSWLITVTARKCLLWKKQHRAEIEFDEIEQKDRKAITVSASKVLEEAEKEQCLREAIACLPARCRDMIHILFYQQPPLPYTEVAKKLGLAPGSIGAIRGRCLEKLQKSLIDMGF